MIAPVHLGLKYVYKKPLLGTFSSASSRPAIAVPFAFALGKSAQTQAEIDATCYIAKGRQIGRQAGCTLSLLSLYYYHLFIIVTKLFAALANTRVFVGPL